MNDDDKLVSLRELAQRVGPRRNGKPTHPDTIREWCITGLPTVPIQLKSEFRGGIRLSCWTWFLAWSEAVAAFKAGRKAALQAAVRPAAKQDRKAKKRQEAAQRELESLPG